MSAGRKRHRIDPEREVAALRHLVAKLSHPGCCDTNGCREEYVGALLGQPLSRFDRGVLERALAAAPISEGDKPMSAAGVEREGTDRADANEGEAAFLAGLLAEALRAHRADMHNKSGRPCSTCSQSARALRQYDEWRAR